MLSTSNRNKNRHQTVKSTPSQSTNGYTISVDSAEKRDSIVAALNDIESYKKTEKERIDSELASIKSAAEREINARAETDTATARQELIKKANEEAENIKKTAKTEAEKASKEFLENAKKESDAAEEKHKEYIKKMAELTSQKIDYRHEALKDVESELKTISAERESLLEEVAKYKGEYDRLTREVSALKGDLEYYESEFGNIGEASGKITKLESEKEFMDTQYRVLKEHLQSKDKEILKLQEKLLELGEDPEETQTHIQYLESQVRELTEKLDKYPSDWETIVLRSNELDRCKERMDEISENNLELSNQLFDLQTQKEEIELNQKMVRVLELQRDELKAELERNIAQYENRNGKVFATLSKIDSEQFPTHPTYKINLEKLCDDFRAYLNCRGSDLTEGKKSLYYDLRTIRTFIAGFASSRTMILEGLSGTGKSSLPQAFADFMGSVTDVVPVQSSWKDKNDLLGFYNDFKKQYIETDFLKCLYRAVCDQDNIHLIVLDEMNLSRIEYYFADVLSKLELAEGKKSITLIPNAQGIGGTDEAWPEHIVDGEIVIPDNVWFIGTANKDDSTFTITDKVYDRSVVIDFDKKGRPDKTISYAMPLSVNFKDFKKALNSVKWASTEDEQKFVRHMERLDKLLNPFDITFGNRIYRQLETFVPAYIQCGGTMEEAIDVMFSLKVIRKLEGLYDEGTKANLEKLETKLDDMPLSKERVRKLSSRIA